MKNLLKLTLALTLMLGASSLYAQKFGRINTNDLIAAMPETAQAQTNLDTFIKDYSDMFEAMQVEINTKMADLQKNEATLSESMKKLKYEELQNLSARMEEFQRTAQQDIQQKQAELMQPVQEKALAAINAVAKAGGYVAIFDTSIPTLAYYDEALVEDVLTMVKGHLGL